MCRAPWLFPLVLLSACAQESTAPSEQLPPGDISLAASPTVQCTITQVGTANYNVVVSWSHYPVTMVEIIRELGTVGVSYPRPRKKGTASATADEAVASMRVWNGTTIVAQGGCTTE
jgi:hypothetical protein